MKMCKFIQQGFKCLFVAGLVFTEYSEIFLSQKQTASLLNTAGTNSFARIVFLLGKLVHPSSATTPCDQHPRKQDVGEEYS